MKKTRIIRFIGIVCWFLALFILIGNHQGKKTAEDVEDQPAEIVNQMEESGADSDSTVLFPTE